MLKEVLRICIKTMSADVKTDFKQQEIKELVTVS